ncbi:MAG: hypothetical protein HUJ95_04565 [Bacteroidales bacterium]|nr:hypothetical protein [Bacteroidales bacterium]
MNKSKFNRDCNYHDQTLYELRDYLVLNGDVEILKNETTNFIKFLKRRCSVYPNFGKDVRSSLKETDILSLFILYLLSIVPEGSVEQNISRFRCLCNVSTNRMAKELDVTRQTYFNMEHGKTVLMNTNVYKTARILSSVFSSDDEK